MQTRVRPPQLPVGKQALPRKDHCTNHGYSFASTLYINEMGYEAKCPLVGCPQGILMQGSKLDEAVEGILKLDEEETLG